MSVLCQGRGAAGSGIRAAGKNISGLCAVLLCVAVLAGVPRRLAAEHPRARSISAPAFADVDAIVQEAVEQGKIPGGVVVIGHNGRIVYKKAFGSGSIEPSREPMTVDTIFDLASLTKCIATTTAVMQLVEAGRVRLNDPVRAYLPWFSQNGKEQITVRELLTHYSGLAPDLDLMHSWQGRDTALKMVADSKPVNLPGTRFVYSDINFETPGISGRSGLRTAFEPICREKHLRAARDDEDSISSSQRVVAAHCSHGI